MNEPQLPRKDSAMKAIRWVAVAGFGVGFLGLALLVLLSRNQFRDFAFLDNPACKDFSASAKFNSNERRWNWDGGDSVDITLADVTVRYGEGSGHELIAKGSTAALASIEIRDGNISSSCRNSPLGKITLILPAIQFRHIGITGPGRVELTAVEQPDLEIGIIGPGSIYGDGKIDHIDANITGPGTLKLAGVLMNSLDLNVIGPADVEAGPKSKAHINVVGPGTIRLLSRPPVLETNIIGPTTISYATD